MPITAYRPSLRLAMLMASAAIISGCASPGDIASSSASRESTLSDAVSQAQGQQGRRHAASQIQLGFGNTGAPAQSAQAEATEAAQAAEAIRPLREPKTFLGTVPCLEGPNCPAVRLTLTIAPNGHWRARYEAVQGPQQNKPHAEQGCWYPAGSQPWRIVLRVPGQEGTLASLSFVNDNVLRVQTFKERTPTLSYQLTRQPDIDAVAELDGQPTPDCSVS